MRGTLFDSNDVTGLVCGVNTGFFVDHSERLTALNIFWENWNWPLRDLPDGHEFLLVLPVQRRRSQPHSTSASLKVHGKSEVCLQNLA